MDPFIINELAKQCAPTVAPQTIQALVTKESAHNPFAIGINSGKWKLERQPKNLGEAVATAKELIEMGINIDVGLGQINVRNLKWIGYSITQIFEPCNNLRAAEKVLRDCFDRAVKVSSNSQIALMKSLSCYNTGNFENGFRNGYVEKVYKIASQQQKLFQPPIYQLKP
jgi:type IV secretion system protein VirB1